MTEKAMGEEPKERAPYYGAVSDDVEAFRSEDGVDITYPPGYRTVAQLKGQAVRPPEGERLGLGRF